MLNIAQYISKRDYLNKIALALEVASLWPEQVNILNKEKYVC